MGNILSLEFLLRLFLLKSEGNSEDSFPEWARFDELKEGDSITLNAFTRDNFFSEVVQNYNKDSRIKRGGLTNIVNDPYKCILSFRKKGLSYAIIGSRLGLSRERVRQIVNGARGKQIKMLTPDTDADTLLSFGKVAKLLGVHINTVRRWSDQGVLPAQRIGIRCERRFRRKEIDNFLSSIASRSAAQLV